MPAKFSVFGNEMQVVARHINPINILRAPKANDCAFYILEIKYMLVFCRFG